MAMPWTPLDALAPQTCICYGPEAEGCFCVEAERTLRAYIGGHRMPPLLPSQRAWCLEEIDRVEGYDRKDYTESTDRELAKREAGF